MLFEYNNHKKMELKIKKKTDNKLLKRQEIEFTVSHKTASTPSRLSVRDNIAAKMGSKPELVVIPQLNTRYGAGESRGVAHAYKNEKQKLAVEPKYVLKRFEAKEVKEEKTEEATPVAEAPAEEKKEEAPAEEAKPEAPTPDASDDSKRAEGEPEEVTDSKPSDSEAKKEDKKEEEKTE